MEDDHEPSREQSGNDNPGDDGQSRDTSSQSAPLGGTGTVLRDGNQPLQNVNPLATDERQESATKSEIKGVDDPLGKQKEVPQDGSDQDSAGKKSIGASGVRSDPTSTVTSPNRCGDPIMTVTTKDVLNSLLPLAKIGVGTAVLLSPEPVSKTAAANAVVGIAGGLKDLAPVLSGVLVDRPMQQVQDQVRCAVAEQNRQAAGQIGQAAAGFQSGIRVP